MDEGQPNRLLQKGLSIKQGKVSTYHHRLLQEQGQEKDPQVR